MVEHRIITIGSKLHSYLIDLFNILYSFEFLHKFVEKRNVFQGINCNYLSVHQEQADKDFGMRQGDDITRSSNVSS